VQWQLDEGQQHEVLLDVQHDDADKTALCFFFSFFLPNLYKVLMCFLRRGGWLARYVSFLMCACSVIIGF